MVIYDRLGDNDGSRHCFTESTDEMDEVFLKLELEFFKIGIGIEVFKLELGEVSF